MSPMAQLYLRNANKVECASAFPQRAKRPRHNALQTSNVIVPERIKVSLPAPSNSIMKPAVRGICTKSSLHYLPPQ